MTDKLFPLNLAKPTDELKRLIAEHPDYPIVVLAEDELCNGLWAWIYATSISFHVGEVLDCYLPWKEEYVCTDRDEFNEDLEDWLWDKMCSDLYDETGRNDAEPNEDDFQKLLAEEKSKYEPYWKKVIIIYAGT